MIVRRCTCALALVLMGLISNANVCAQGLGVELHNNLMPASGGMSGASLARPQDIQSSLGGNPATLAQHKGVKFSFGGAWVEPTINIDNDANIGANITPYEGKSSRPGSVLGNLTATQDLSELGLPATMGVGLLTASGLGSNFRHIVQSNGTTAELVVLQVAAGVGMQVTDRIAIGAELALGSATMDGPFTFNTAATPDYALRGAIGMTYDVNRCTTVGAYWLTEQSFKFNDFVQIGGPGNPFRQVAMSLPNTYGIGVANESLMDGRLLLAVDFKHLDWSNTDFFGALWKDQFVMNIGMQLTTWGCYKLRAGYTYTENLTKFATAPTIGGVTPQAGLDYFQALFPAINQHRFTFGVGVPDVIGTMDIDFFAGGMPETSERTGNTGTSIESYWIGFGTTWEFR